MNATIPTTLAQGLDAIVQTNAPLAAHTWFGVGGSADMLVQPKSEDALRELVRRCFMENLPVRVLGSGAVNDVSSTGRGAFVTKLVSI
jgi:UDP-N-acetylmuramate dehydrogenase